MQKCTCTRDGQDTERPVIKEKFNADVVMCIDCTSSMSGIIGTIKNNAMNFYPDIKRKCEEQGKEILSMRVKVIGFRDHVDFAPFEISDFFTMPDDEREFKTFISNLSDYGGGDAPEIGYEALEKAMQSEWRTRSDVRQVVILWTDAESHPLPGSDRYTRLKDTWNDGSGSRRLIMFAPPVPSWNMIENTWNNSVRHDVTLGGGLSDVDYDDILKALSESI